MRRSVGGLLAALVAATLIAGTPFSLPAQPPAGPQPPRIQNVPARVAMQVPGAAGRGEGEFSGIIFPSDRAAMRRLNQAIELLDSERYSEAVRYLGSILEADEDFFFQPDPNAPFHRSLKSEAERLLGELPAEGRQTYSLQYGAEARRLLDDAVAVGDATEVATVSRQYFHTEAGYEATLLLAADHLDRGRPLAAALCYRRLKDSAPAASAWEPALSLQLATSWLRAGMADAAIEVLRRLKADYGETRPRVAGRTIELFADEADPIAWLSATLGPQRELATDEVSQWAMFRGDPTRTATSGGGSPLLTPRWIVPTTNDPLVERMLVELERSHLDRSLALLPSAHPLVIDDIVLMRTVSNLLAVDFVTGKRLWEVPVDHTLEGMLTGEGGAPLVGKGQLAMGLEERLWDDATYGTLSSDGQHVFSIEDLSAAGPFLPQRVVRMANGQIARGQLAPKPFNRLVALDIHSGKLAWEIGGEPNTGELELAGTFFLGPPLPLGGELYVLAEMNGEVRLLALNAETSELEWSQQLAMLERNILQDPIRRLAGVSPSYADGVLVCPTAAGAVVAVDLTTRSLLWGFRYETSTQQTNMAQMIMLRGAGQVMTQMNGERAFADRWSDSSVTVVDGHVVLTPVESDSIICLNLLDGTLAWERPRSDGRYIAGVHDDRLIVVGRSTVRALALADGEPAWESAEVHLPDGAAPSGRGFINGHELFIPLTSAEVATYDLNNGELLARSRSRDGSIPGNLTCYKGSVLAQSADSLESFYQLAQLEDQVAVRLSAEPSDALALALRGEIQLHSGDIVAATADLRRSLEISPSPHTQELLVEALLEGLRSDFGTYRDRLDEIERLAEVPEQKARFYRLLAEGLHHGGEVNAAFVAYMRFTDPALGRPDLERIDQAHAVRRDRWVQTRLALLRAGASTDETAEIDDVLEQRLAAAVAEPGVGGLRRFVDYFDGHPMSLDARRELVSRYLEAGDPLAAEIELRHQQRSEDPSVGCDATARLAELLHQVGRPDDAAMCYRRLTAEFADVAAGDGRTGQQIVASLDAEDPVRRLLAGDTQWPLGVKVTAREDKPGGLTHSQGLAIVGDRQPFFHGIEIQIDQMGRTLLGRDGHGVPLWKVNVVPPGSNGRVAFNQMLNKGHASGHLLLLHLGQELLAIDTLGREGQGREEWARVLWRHDLTESIAGMAVNNFQQPRQMRVAWGNRVIVNGPGMQPAGSVATVTDRIICFISNRKLVAVDPLSGEVVWERRNVAPGSDVWGDNEVLLLAAPDSKQALVLRTDDGSELDTVEVPESGERMCTQGRMVVTWRSARLRSVVRLIDPYGEGELWEIKFSNTAKGHLIENDELAVVEPNGRFVLINLVDGSLKIDERIERIRELQEIYIQRSRDHYVLVVNRPWQPQNNTHVRPLPGGYFGTTVALVNGQIYGFDRHSGERLWTREVKNQGLWLWQPSELPVLTLACQFTPNANRNSNKTELALACIDKRTGQVLHEQTFDSSARSSALEIVGDDERNIVAIDTQDVRVEIEFSDDASTSDATPSEHVIDPLAKVEDESQQSPAEESKRDDRVNDTENEPDD